MQLAQLIEEKGVGFTFESGAKLSKFSQERWQLEARDFSCHLFYKGRTMSFDYWMGRGIKHDPTALDVLDTLLLDASGLDSSRNFREWASEYGFDIEDPESAVLKKAKKTYSTVQSQTGKLKKLLGSDYQKFANAER